MQGKYRILIVDDNIDIHNDFTQTLMSFDEDNRQDLANLEKTLFNNKIDFKSVENENLNYFLDHAYSGEEAIKLVEKTVEDKNPYSIAFVDARMAPGINGIDTIAGIWQIDPFIEIIICTAYLDYTWNEIIIKLGITDKLLILKKPFDAIEVKQITLALIKKWTLGKQTRKYEKKLQKQVEIQTSLISSMFDFANKLHTFRHLDDILDSIIITIIKFIKSERISIMLLNETGDYLYIRRAVGIPEDIIKKTRIKIGDSIAGKVFSIGKPVIVNDIIKEGYSYKYSEYNAFISSPVICSPLIGNKIKIGVINVTNRTDNLPFSDNDVRILSYISYTSAIAINNQLNEMKLEESFLDTIKALAKAIEAKDTYTGGHSERVTSISIAIKSELGLTGDDYEFMNYAGILHDIGKIGISEAILTKPKKLTPEEYETVKQHPIIGEKILSNIKMLENAREVIRHHHERIDGSGYPDGLSDKQISIGARIIAVADCFDAMNSDRSYREKKPLESIKSELIKMVERNKLDRDCVDALFRYLDKNNIK